MTTTTVAYQGFVADTRPTPATRETLVRPAAKRSRPGATRKLALESTPEGRATLDDARRMVGAALIADGATPLSALRLRAGLSQADVAARTGIQQPMLSRIENGRVADPQITTLRALAGSYGVTLDELSAALEAAVEKVNPDGR